MQKERQKEKEKQKQKQRQKGKNQYTLKTAQRQAFLQVFNLHARDGRINSKDLKAMFDRIGYFITEEHFRDICVKTFEFQETVTFQEFMDIFRIKDSAYNLVDIKNAFRLIAGQQDDIIPLTTISQIFRKNGIEKQRIDDLFTVLADYVDEKANTFNYKMFLSHLS